MESPNSSINKKKVMDASIDAQALRVVLGTPLALARPTVAGPSGPTEPLAITEVIARLLTLLEEVVPGPVGDYAADDRLIGMSAIIFVT
ncbi:UNVERIFIED_CONTAM: hypothetical protein Sradi_1518100 [Sesamum radiatum]|uniref:Uncharacterized protein n=1 Tax=Sesamum radiatum TaxID=300843 RepID=A0AAW2U8F5_SESRA